MTLAALQLEFMGQVLDDERPLPASWRQGMAAGLEVYRNAYRARLVEALRETFPFTARWAGDKSFRAAAAHYLISRPPTGWTLDRVGEGFVETLQALFADDPDVADLAWLEGAMHRAFTAPDQQPSDLAGFVDATAGFGEDDWAHLRLRFASSLQLRMVRTDCAALWRSLNADEERIAEARLTGPTACLVWRENLNPVFRLLDGGEGKCLASMIHGGTFGEVCAQLAETHDETIAAELAGEMLRRWLSSGWIVSVGGQPDYQRSGKAPMTAPTAP